MVLGVDGLGTIGRTSLVEESTVSVTCHASLINLLTGNFREQEQTRLNSLPKSLRAADFRHRSWQEIITT